MDNNKLKIEELREKLIEIIPEAIKEVRDNYDSFNKKFGINKEVLGNKLEAHFQFALYSLFMKDKNFICPEFNLKVKKLKEIYNIEHYEKNRNFRIDLILQIDSTNILIELKSDSNTIKSKGFNNHIKDIIRLNDLVIAFQFEYGVFITTNINDSNILDSKNFIECEIIKNTDKTKIFMPLEKQKEYLNKKLREEEGKSVFLLNNSNKSKLEIKAIDIDNLVKNCDEIFIQSQKQNKIQKLSKFYEHETVNIKKIKDFYKIQEVFLGKNKKSNCLLLNSLGANVYFAFKEKIKNNEHWENSKNNNFNDCGEKRWKEINHKMISANTIFSKNKKNEEEKINKAGRNDMQYKVNNKRTDVIFECVMNKFKPDKEKKYEFSKQAGFDKNFEGESWSETFFEIMSFLSWYEDKFKNILDIFKIISKIDKDQKNIEKYIKNRYKLKENKVLELDDTTLNYFDIDIKDNNNNYKRESETYSFNRFVKKLQENYPIETENKELSIFEIINTLLN